MAHPASFDDLDGNVITNQQWNDLYPSHAADMAVHWPGGHVTRGIEKRLGDLQAVIACAPDTRIKRHRVEVGQGGLGQ